MSGKNKENKEIKKNRKTEEVKEIKEVDNDRDTEGRPKTYTQKIIDKFVNGNKDLYTKAEIEELIRDYAKEIYDKKKADGQTFSFGKYKYRTVSEVAQFDKGYIKWLSKQDILNNFEELKFEIAKHL